MNGIHTDRRDHEVRETELPEYRSRYPFQTVKCIGPALFRSQAARDYACMMDLEADFRSWRCQIEPLGDPRAGKLHHVDFVGEHATGRLLIDVSPHDAPDPPHWIHDAARDMGCTYFPVHLARLGLEQRTANVRELARYAGSRASLGDRIRLLAALQDASTLTLSECLSCVREGSPMPTVAALIFAGFLEVDLDLAPLGPDTAVRARSE